MPRAAGKERDPRLNLTLCLGFSTSQNCLALSSSTSPCRHPHPPPPSFPAEAASFVSLVFLPLSLSDSCDETCHLEMAPAPLQRCLRTVPTATYFICSLTQSFNNPPLEPAQCWPPPRHQDPGPSL